MQSLQPLDRLLKIWQSVSMPGKHYKNCEALQRSGFKNVPLFSDRIVEVTVFISNVTERDTFHLMHYHNDTKHILKNIWNKSCSLTFSCFLLFYIYPNFGIDFIPPFREIFRAEKCKSGQFGIHYALSHVSCKTKKN